VASFASTAFSTSAFDGDAYSLDGEAAAVLAGGVKRKIKPMPKGFMPWEKEEDDFIEEVIEEIKRPKLRIVKKAQPDFDSTLEAERIDRELIAELQESERIRKKRIKRRKAIEMLLLS